MKNIILHNTDFSFKVEYVTDLVTNGENFTITQIIGLDDIEQHLAVPFKSAVSSLTAIKTLAASLGLNVSTQVYGGAITALVDNNVVALAISTTTVANGKIGVKQIETAVIAGTIEAAGAGDATVTITSGLFDEDLVVSVAVANDDTASDVAGKIRTALELETSITDNYVVGGTTVNVSLTAIQQAANDTTLNIAYTNDTCLGLTPDASSNNTTAGVAPTRYGVQLATVGGLGTKTFEVTTGTLPAGLTLSPTGALTGIPTAVAVTTFTVTVEDQFGGSDTQELTLTTTAS